MREGAVKQCKMLGEAIIDKIRSTENKYNLVCIGSSGLYIATVMQAINPDVFDIVYLRKDKETHHAMGNVVSAKINRNPYIWVDDFICTGKTMENVFEKFDSYACEYNTNHVFFAKIKHIALLGGSNSSSAEKMKEFGVETYIEGI